MRCVAGKGARRLSEGSGVVVQETGLDEVALAHVPDGEVGLAGCWSGAAGEARRLGMATVTVAVRQNGPGGDGVAAGLAGVCECG